MPRRVSTNVHTDREAPSNPALAGRICRLALRSSVPPTPATTAYKINCALFFDWNDEPALWPLRGVFSRCSSWP